jgi:hypothetical protein
MTLPPDAKRIAQDVALARTWVGQTAEAPTFIHDMMVAVLTALDAETKRAQGYREALQPFAAIWRDYRGDGAHRMAVSMDLLKDADAALSPAPATEPPPAPASEEASNMLLQLRSDGWLVAVHNDYRQNGRVHTFWLFTKGDQCVKGEGLTDADALKQVIDALISRGRRG